VPNLAAREHLKNIVPVIKTSLREANLTSGEIDLIGVTSGPGLIPALLIGVNAAKTLSYIWQKPLLGIHHIEGHIYANFVRGMTNDKFPMTKTKIKFPVLCLVVSGGHTQLIYMKNHLQYEIIGQTLDDAVGEAFDKVARILNIGYPGGPAISRFAEKWKSQFPISNFQSSSKSQIPNYKQTLYSIKFPRPMLNKNNFDFSFTGLKTAVLYETKKHLARNASLASASSRSDADGPTPSFSKKYISKICHEFQQASIDVLIAKTLKAAEKYLPKTIMLAGGVSANIELRKQLGKAIETFLPTTRLDSRKRLVDARRANYQLPTMDLTGDNATMIAAATYFRFQKMSAAKRKSIKENWKKITADANLKMANK
jgi:N6-L-threonylcarbamoyladenine synthase